MSSANASDLDENAGRQPGRGPGAPRRSLVTALATNSGSQLAGSVATVVFGWLVFVAATRALGPSVYGELATANVMLFFVVQIVDAGLSTAIVRDIAREPESAERAVGASVALRVVVSLCFLAVGLAATFVLPLAGGVRLAVAIGSLGAFFTAVNLSLLPVLQARLRIHWSVAATVVGRAVTLGLTLAFIALGFGLAGVVWASVLGLGVTLAGTYLAVRRVVRVRPRIDRAYWLRLLRASIVLSAAVVIGLIYFRIDLFLLALLRPSREVGLYGVAYKFVELSTLVNTAFVATFFPTITRFLQTRDPRTRSFLQSSFDVTLAAALPAVVVGITVAPQLVVLAAGSKFEAGAGALQLLAPYLLLTFPSSLFLYVLIASGREKLLLEIVTAVLVLNVVLNLVFIPSYGYKAAAVTSVASELCVLLALGYAVRRTNGFRPHLGYTALLLVVAGVMAAVILVVPGPWPLATLLGLVVYAGLVLALPGSVRRIGGSLWSSARASLATR